MSERAPTILVVDDNEAERYFVARILRKSGFETCEAANGADALRMAVDQPDLVTLDVRMPGLNGFEVCRRLKNDPVTRDIPVLHISASFTTPEAKAEGLEGGADGYLTHPLDPIELVATVRALLRARRAEVQVRAAAREWSATFDLIEDAICLTGADGGVVRCNRAFARRVGRPFREIIGRPLQELVPELAPLIAAGGTGAVELQIGARHFRVSSGAGLAGPTRGQEEDLRAWVLGDVTERRRAEESLRQAQRLETVGRLAGGVAHETNNQMTVVLGCANFVLRHRGLPTEVRNDIEQIRHAAERTAGITAQLLAFGRRQLSRPEIAALNGVIERMRPVLERTLGQLVTVELDLSPALPMVKVDPGQLDQVLLNLAINGRDAMAEGGTFTVRTSPVRLAGADGGRFVGEEIPPGTYARVTVSDTGLGMDEETLRRAFEPFFTTKGVGQGTGLGLSMVYGIVKQNGGYISISSAPRKGTTFSLYFPEVEVGSEAREARNGSSRAAVRRTLLLVEDDPAVRSIVVRELEAREYRVLEAANGREAIELVRTLTGPLDAVITDVQLPEVGGRELGDQIAAMRPGIPVVFMSGHPDEEIAQVMSTSGTPFIQKPFTGEELASLVEGLLAGR
ncbi:MAG TPA: response regulator [Gemmatimonadales bacterium]